MAKFRRRVPTIEAMQFNGLESYLDIVVWMRDCGDTCALAGEVKYSTPLMLLQTMEGTAAASPGDWIIRGEVDFYPCKPDIFAATYEPVEGDENDG